MLRQHVKTKKRCLPVLAGLVFAATASGQAVAADGACSAAVIRALAPANVAAAGTEEGGVVVSACKVWPYDPALTLAVMAWPEAGSPSEPGERRIHREVAILRGTSVVARHGATIEEDAAVEFSGSSLRLDTARYDLAPGKRAFGVVFTSSARGPSCPDAGTDDEMTLFLREGNSLRPVLATFLGTWEYAPGAGCPMARTASHARNVTNITLKVLPSRSHGFADIQRTSSTRRENDNGDLTGPAKVRSKVLRYDGKSYGLDIYTDLQ